MVSHPFHKEREMDGARKSTAIPKMLQGKPLEQNQSKRALDESLKGGFFLRKKPLEGIATGYSYSGFAIVDFFRHIFCSTDRAQTAISPCAVCFK